MGFLDFIEKQQRKPRAIRQRIALSISIIIMIVIVAVWLATLGLVFDEEKGREAESMTSPFSVLMDNLKEFGGIIKKSFPLKAD